MIRDDAKRFSSSGSTGPDFPFWDSSGPHSPFWDSYGDADNAKAKRKTTRETKRKGKAKRNNEPKVESIAEA